MSLNAIVLVTAAPLPADELLDALFPGEPRQRRETVSIADATRSGFDAAAVGQRGRHTVLIDQRLLDVSFEPRSESGLDERIAALSSRTRLLVASFDGRSGTYGLSVYSTGQRRRRRVETPGGLLVSDGRKLAIERRIKASGEQWCSEVGAAVLGEPLCDLLIGDPAFEVEAYGAVAPSTAPDERTRPAWTAPPEIEPILAGVVAEASAYARAMRDSGVVDASQLGEIRALVEAHGPGALAPFRAWFLEAPDDWAARSTYLRATLLLLPPELAAWAALDAIVRVELSDFDWDSIRLLLRGAAMRAPLERALERDVANRHRLAKLKDYFGQFGWD